MLDDAVWRRFNKVIEVPRPSKREIREYIDRFVQPLMSEKLTGRYVSALEGLSYSDLSTAAKNALCRATLRGDGAFTRFDLVHETYVLKKHGTEDKADYLDYLLSHGCTIAAIHKNTDMPRRMITDASKALNERTA